MPSTYTISANKTRGQTETYTEKHCDHSGVFNFFNVIIFMIPLTSVHTPKIRSVPYWLTRNSDQNSFALKWLNYQEN